jgi:hypothetical protein
MSQRHAGRHASVIRARLRPAAAARHRERRKGRQAPTVRSCQERLEDFRRRKFRRVRRRLARCGSPIGPFAATLISDHIDITSVTQAVTGASFKHQSAPTVRSCQERLGDFRRRKFRRARRRRARCGSPIGPFAATLISDHIDITSVTRASFGALVNTDTTLGAHEVSGAPSGQCLEPGARSYRPVTVTLEGRNSGNRRAAGSTRPATSRLAPPHRDHIGVSRRRRSLARWSSVPGRRADHSSHCACSHVGVPREACERGQDIQPASYEPREVRVSVTRT